MANRDESDARQHETLPGPGPGPNPPLGDSGVHPVEQMVDAAIERIARQQDAPSEHVQQPASLARRTGKTPTRLRWKGLDVSDEFRSYAERIARGEDLPPFEGRVLAEPNPAFPWGSAQGEPGRKSRVALWSSALIVLGLLAWVVALKLGAPAPDDRQPVTLKPAALQPAALRPSTAAPNEPTTAARPALPTSPEGVQRDAVEAPALEASGATTETASVSGSPASLAAAASGENAPAVPPSAAVVHASLAPAVSEEVATPGAQALAPSGTASNEGVGAELAREGTSPPAAGGVVAGGDGTSAAVAPVAPVAAAPAAASEAAREDDFGIMSLPYPAPVAPAAPPAPSGAKSSASVGDLANGRQAPAGAVRKEPGSESSAKGSLLVESPSF